MLNPLPRANDGNGFNAHFGLSIDEPLALSVIIATDDEKSAKALLTTCKIMRAFSCTARVAALDGEATRLRVRTDEILIVDAANAAGRRLDPALCRNSPCIAILPALADGMSEIPQAHAALVMADMTPATLEIAVRVAQNNYRATMTARRAAEAAERASIAAQEAQKRVLEEIGPLAHALDGLLEIMSADAPQASTPSQFRLLQNWTRDLVSAVGRHRTATARPVSTLADASAIVEDAVALFHARADDLGHTVVLSAPAEPVLVPIGPERLQTAIRELIGATLDREGRDRRIDIVLWRSTMDVRMAIVSGSPVRRRFDMTDDDQQPAAPAAPAAECCDAGFRAALALFRDVGATVEASCTTASNASLLISMPLA